MKIAYNNMSMTSSQKAQMQIAQAEAELKRKQDKLEAIRNKHNMAEQAKAASNQAKRDLMQQRLINQQ